jgi:hypothetical protein
MKINIPFATGIFNFYYSGFRNMSDWGKRVWLIIIIKLFIIFVLLKFFFFPDFLKKKFENEKEISNYVLENLTTSNITND